MIAAPTNPDSKPPQRRLESCRTHPIPRRAISYGTAAGSTSQHGLPSEAARNKFKMTAGHCRSCTASRALAHTEDLFSLAGSVRHNSIIPVRQLTIGYTTTTCCVMSWNLLIVVSIETAGISVAARGHVNANSVFSSLISLWRTRHKGHALLQQYRL